MEEFDALGLAMPSFAHRMGRLEEVLALARSLFDAGSVDVVGEHVIARKSRLERRAAYGLERISLTGLSGVPGGTTDPIWFCRNVLPLLN